jgi:DNA-binding response OmpR family regulator
VPPRGAEADENGRCGGNFSGGPRELLKRAPAVAYSTHLIQMTISSFDSTAAAQAAFDRSTLNVVASSNHVHATTRILLISDDAQLRLLLSELLLVHGYDVVSIGSAAICACRPSDWDAAIVDTAAPRAAARWLRALEATTRVPTLAIATANSTASAGPLWNRVDAVLHEPLDSRKLMLIMRGLLASCRQGMTRADQSLSKGPLTLHSLLNAATVAGRETSLTEVETRILRELMLAASTPVSRDRLTRCGSGRGWSPDDRCLDTHIKRLRRKLGPDRHGRTPIRTVRGVGYLLLERWQPAS